MKLVIDEEYCKGCGLCFVVCKVRALGAGDVFNAKGYKLPSYDDTVCVACANCEWICPELAITVFGKAHKGSG